MPNLACKVLVGGRSCHGGSMVWSLPAKDDAGNWTAGDWHEVKGVIAACSNGLHLTRRPVNWWLSGSAIYEAEYEGDISEADGDDKIAVRRCRLLREVSWEDHGVWTEGEHSISSGYARASGSATVRASGSATVEASDSVTVEAFDSVTVRAFGSVTVEASDSVTVRAFGSVTVRAFGSVTVEASDSVTVRASGSATAIRTRWHRGGYIKLSDLAAVIDRRVDGTVEFHAAPWSDAPEGTD